MVTELAAVVGIALVAVALGDAWLTVLHPDIDGPLANGVRRSVWRLATYAGARLPALRRHLLALAGPVLLVATFGLWITLVILGFGLITWSMLDGYAAAPELGALTFLDALYFAGTTITVLGYGDIHPLSTTGKVAAMAGAGMGFAMFTAMATYMIEVVIGLASRNRFTLLVYDEAQGDGGAEMIRRTLAEEGVEGARRRCRAWADLLRELDETMHRYPLVALTYRSRRAAYQPEEALRRACEAAVAALTFADLESGWKLRGAAQSLALALRRLQGTIADTYLSEQVRRQITEPTATEDDRRAVARLAAALVRRTPAHAAAVTHPAAPDGNPDKAAPAAHGRPVELLARSRAFLAGLHDWSGLEVRLNL